MVGDTEVVVDSLRDTDDLDIKWFFSEIFWQLVYGVHWVISADVEESADIALFESFGYLSVNIVIVLPVGELVSARAENGGRGLLEQFHVVVGEYHWFQVNEVVADDTLDAVDRAENSVYLSNFQWFLKNSHKGSVDRTGRAARLCYCNVHHNFNILYQLVMTAILSMFYYSLFSL